MATNNSTQSANESLRVGECYEITAGPASAVERTSRGVFKEFDPDANTYTFQMEDGHEVSFVEHEIDGVRHIAEGC